MLGAFFLLEMRPICAIRCKLMTFALTTRIRIDPHRSGAALVLLEAFPTLGASSMLYKEFTKERPV